MMANVDLSQYGITGTTEIVYNPSYEMLFEEETKPTLEGYEKGQVSELGAVNVADRTRPYLQEHATILMEEDALPVLQATKWS